VDGDRLNVTLHDVNGSKLYGVARDLQWRVIYKDRSHEKRHAAELFEETHTGKVLDALLSDLVEIVAAR
jgi:hypothetical protein